MSWLEAFVARREAPRSLANAFAFGEGDIGEAGGVGEVVLNALELFIVREFAGDGVGVVGNVEGVGVVDDVNGGVVVVDDDDVAGVAGGGVVDGVVGGIVVDAAVAAVVVLETRVDGGDCGRSREGGGRCRRDNYYIDGNEEDWDGE